MHGRAELERGVQQQPHASGPEAPRARGEVRRGGAHGRQGAPPDRQDRGGAANDAGEGVPALVPSSQSSM